MIEVLIRKSDGDTERVGLALRKSDVGHRLWTALQKGQEGIVLSDMTSLDSGRLPISKLKLIGYTPDEIERAIEKRLAEIDAETDELRELRQLLGDREQWEKWAQAQGGDPAAQGSSRRRS